jgi:hypothetical protein
MSIFLEKTLDEIAFEDEIPNEETIKAMEDDELFSYNSAEEMVADALGDPNWKNSYKNIDKTE